MDAVARQERLALAELLFGAALWAFGFVAGRWMLEGPGPFWGNTIRFAVATAVSLPFVLWRGPSRELLRESFWQAMPAGIALSICLVLQLSGLAHTTVANSAFITCLYVIFVPVLGPFFGTGRTPGRLWFFAWLALAGSYAMAAPNGGRWNVGDLLTLGSAVFAAFQILLIQRVAPRIRSVFLFNSAQSLWAGLPALVLALVTAEPIHFPFPPIAWAGILTLALGVTLIAFVIQLRVQKILPVTLVSVVYLLESPMAAVMAYGIFNERLSRLQVGGASLIVVSALLAITFGRPRR